MRRAALTTCVLALVAAPAAAQSEADLRDAFEGKSVRVKIDMPATQEGIDVFPDARRPLDFAQYSARLKSYGIALRNGDSVMVTKVRLKEKAIEFQLGGGGYGTFGDDTGSVSTPTASKTQREKDLEKLVKSETDAYRKQRLQRELDDLRQEREREDARNKSVAASANEAKKARIADTRLHSGSRFNIRYQEGVPRGLDADGVMRALQEYVDFPFAADRRPAQAAPPLQDQRPPAPSGDIRKGMTLAEMEQVLGRPVKSTPRTEGSVHLVTAIYARGDEIITADFVEGVLVKYSISSK